MDWQRIKIQQLWDAVKEDRKGNNSECIFKRKKAWNTAIFPVIYDCIENYSKHRGLQQKWFYYSHKILFRDLRDLAQLWDTSASLAINWGYSVEFS